MEKVNGLSGNALTTVPIVHLFFVCLHRSFLKDVIIYQTNERLDETLTLGDVISWIDVWFLLEIFREKVRRTFGHQIRNQEQSVPHFVSNVLCSIHSPK